MPLLPVCHVPGRHCASTGLADLARFHGLDWSEAFCFGLGAGLGIWYLSFPGTGASRMIHVRSHDIEAQFFARIGLEFSWTTDPDPAESEKALISVLDRGLPAMIQSDIFHLPYFATSTHFPGHVIVVWGYDAGRKVFFVTDTERQGLLEVDFDSMRRARHSGNGFFPVEGNLFAPSAIPRPSDPVGMTAEAVRAQSRAILNPPAEFGGLPGLLLWKKGLKDWAGFPDWQWTARFAYQVIERRGTGGGGFRLLFADFLKEASLLVPEIGLSGLSGQMDALGRAWTDLAEALKAASERQEPDFSEAAEKLDVLLDMSRRYHNKAASLGG